MSLTVKRSCEFDRYPRRSQCNIRTDSGHLRDIGVLILQICHELVCIHDRIRKPYQSPRSSLTSDIISLSSFKRHTGILRWNNLGYSQMTLLAINHLIACPETLREYSYAVFSCLECFTRRVEDN